MEKLLDFLWTANPWGVRIEPYMRPEIIYGVVGKGMVIVYVSRKHMTITILEP